MAGTAIVCVSASAKRSLERDAYEAVGAVGDALLRGRRAKDVFEERLASLRVEAPARLAASEAAWRVKPSRTAQSGFSWVSAVPASGSMPRRHSGRGGRARGDRPLAVEVESAATPPSEAAASSMPLASSGGRLRRRSHFLDAFADPLEPSATSRVRRCGSAWNATASPSSRNTPSRNATWRCGLSFESLEVRGTTKAPQSEVSLQDGRRDGEGVVGVRGRPESSSPSAREIRLLHEPRHALASKVVVSRAARGASPPRTLRPCRDAPSCDVATTP